jgi:preprotein translocase subunit SecG
MMILLVTIHVLVCLFLIVVVLLQSGKAADLAGAFGGMGSQTAFGPRGSATLLSKATTVSAIVFMLTSMSLSILATRNAGVGKTVLDSQKPGTTKSAPATKTPSPAAPGGQKAPMTVTPQSGAQVPPVQTTPAQPAQPAQPQPAGQQQQKKK